MSEPPRDAPVLVAAHGEPPYRVEVWDDRRYRWLQFADGAMQTRIDRSSPAALTLPYVQAMAAPLLFHPAPRAAALVGVGGGALARFLLEHFAGVRLRLVESSPAVVEAATRHFGLDPGAPGVDLEVADARDALARARWSADVIFLDVFDAGGLPRWLLEREVHAAAARCLTPRGVVAVNLWVEDDDEFLGVMRGLRAVFDSRVLVLTVPGYRNLVALGFAGAPDPLDLATLRRRAVALAARTGVDFPGMVVRLGEANLVVDGALVVEG